MGQQFGTPIRQQRLEMCSINTEGSDYDPVVFVYLDGGATPVDCDPDAQLLLTPHRGRNLFDWGGGEQRCHRKFGG